MNKSLRKIIQQVPPDYYQKSIKDNFFQRIWHKNKLNEVNNIIPRKKKLKVLDVGCASGWFLNELISFNPAYSGFGIDVYKDAIFYGKKKYPLLELKMGDAHKIPYKPNFFDLVVCISVLEHIYSPIIALKEIKRVLKKNGTVIIEIDSGSIMFSVIWYFWIKFHGKVWKNSHLHSFTLDKLEKLLIKEGFTILKKKKFNFDMEMLFLSQKTTNKRIHFHTSS